VLFEQLLDNMGFRDAADGLCLPEPKSVRGYAPLQLIERFTTSIRSSAICFVRAEAVGMHRKFMAFSMAN
jgi:uncharacterized membrane protein